MSVEDLSTAVASIVLDSLATFFNFIPGFIGGLIVLLVGLAIGGITYRVIIGVLKSIQFEKYLARYQLAKIEGRDIEWSEILAEITRWTVIIIFLIPTLQAWRLDAVNAVLTRVILYIPNVIVAVILAIVGLVFARLAYRVVYSASRSLGTHLAHTAAIVAQWSFVIFVAFLVLHQLGIAQELLRILFAGIVAMMAIAGGLAFGLGGQETARGILESVSEKFRKKD